jgi:hypothetical protein
MNTLGPTGMSALRFMESGGKSAARISSKFDKNSPSHSDR